MNTEEQKIEKLLQPRYKVIADYPYSPYTVGDLVEFSITRTSFHCTTTKEYSSFSDQIELFENYLSIGKLDDWGHLFKKLEWWEDREPEEMPQYAKTKSGSTVRELISARWGKVAIKIDGKMKVRSAKDWFPATKQEYNTQHPTNKSKHEQ